MNERIWTRAPKEVLPVDKKVVQAELQEWNTEIASDSGFEELLPEVEPDNFFYIAVGKNVTGEVVGAYLFRRTPIDYELGAKQKEIDELFLRNKAKKIFGLIPQGNMV